MNLKILCGSCTWKLEMKSALDGDSRITSARYPEFQPTEDEEDVHVLTCITWTQMMLVAPEEIMKNRKIPCDDCGIFVSVHPSSMWLLEKAGREKEIA